MKNKFYKVIALVLALTMSMNTFTIAHANTTSRQDIQTQAIDTGTWIEWIANAVFKVAAAASSAMYNVVPSRTVTSNMARANSGSIKYNDTYGSMSYIDVLADSNYLVDRKPYMSISLSVQTDFINALTGVMAVSLTAPDGSYKINTTLGSNGITAYAVNSQAYEGLYRATYSTTETETWSTQVTLYDNYAPTTRNQMNDDIIIDWQNNKYYTIPSETHMVKERYRQHSIRNNNTMTVGELYNEFWDESLSDFVYSVKSYDAGDEIIISDVIKDISYDEEKNRSVLEFETEYGMACWPFDGNLLSQFKAGDRVAFEFQVVNEFASQGYTFENINYFSIAVEKLYNSNINLNIYDYLLGA